MAKFEIESTENLGMTHSGDVSLENEGTVELTDEEVTTLVNLIRQKQTTDVEELNLENDCPEIYEKLDEACRNAAEESEKAYWLQEAFDNGDYECDLDELMEYCKDELGFEFDGEDSDDDDEDAESEAFEEWLDDYVAGLAGDELVEFLEDKLGIGVDLDGVEYTVEIPQAIIDKAAI